jgi:hypothetical protein
MWPELPTRAEPRRPVSARGAEARPDAAQAPARTRASIGPLRPEPALWPELPELEAELEQRPGARPVAREHEPVEAAAVVGGARMAPLPVPRDFSEPAWPELERRWPELPDPPAPAPPDLADLERVLERRRRLDEEQRGRRWSA